MPLLCVLCCRPGHRVRNSDSTSIYDNVCKYQEISARPRSPGTSYENEDCFKSWIASLVSTSSNIELNTMRTSSLAEKAGICSVKSKHHVIGRCRGIPAIYTTGMKLTSLIYFSKFPSRTDLAYARCLNPLASGLLKT